MLEYTALLLLAFADMLVHRSIKNVLFFNRDLKVSKQT